MKKQFFVLFLVALIITLFAQTPPDTLWTRTYGGSGWDFVYSIEQTNDGGYIFAGQTGSYGYFFGISWLVRLDENGNEIWNRTYEPNQESVAYSVKQTIDDGFILAGRIWVTLYDYVCWIIKTDEDGNEEWNRTYGEEGENSGQSIVQTTDGGYIIAGSTTSFGAGFEDYWLIKLDQNGEEEWNQTYGGSWSDKANSVQQTTDGGFIIAGSSSPQFLPFYNFWLVKTDPMGNEEWSSYFGGSFQDEAFSVQQTADGGYIVAGYTTPEGSNYDDFWLVKTDAFGNEEWNQTYGRDYDDQAYSVQQTIDGGYIIAGESCPQGYMGSDYLLVKTDNSGNEIWNHVHNRNVTDIARSVQQTSNGGFITAGHSFFANGNGYDCLLVKLSSEVSISENVIQQSEASLTIYPNPFNPETTISFSVTQTSSFVTLDILNIKGQKVKTLVNDKLETGKHTAVWNGTDENNKPVSSGIYFYKLKSGKFSETKKCILLK